MERRDTVRSRNRRFASKTMQISLVNLFLTINSVTQCQPEDTHTENSTKTTDINYSPSPPSLQKGEGQLTPSLTFVQRYERLRESQRRLWVYIPRGYFNPSLSPSTKQYSFPSDRQRKTEFLTFSPRITITTIYTIKYMDI